MRILVTGTTGFIGARIGTHLRRAGHSAVSTHRLIEGEKFRDTRVNAQGFNSVALDLAKPNHILELLTQARFQAVIHAAAMAGIGQCERDPQAALLANSTMTASIAQACSEARVRLITLSTDQVFAGGPRASGGAVPPGGYREHDATGPVNHYGFTKQMAEQTILNMNAPGITIVRLALVVGRSLQGARSSSEQLIARVRRGETPTLFRDEFRTPICVADVCSAMEELLPMTGVKLLHLGGPERMNRVELGQRILRMAGLSEACNAVDVPEPAAGEPRRPSDVALDSSLAQRILQRPPRKLEAWSKEYTSS